MTHRDTQQPLLHSHGFGRLHQQRWSSWYHLRPATARPCLRWAAGGQHLHGEGRCDGCCGLAERLTLLDHGATWRAPDGRRVVSAEPYDMSSADVAELRESAAAHGLVVEVLPTSPWFPGRTTAWAAYSSGPLLARPDVLYVDTCRPSPAGQLLHHVGPHA